MNFPLTSTRPISTACRAMGIVDWRGLVAFVHQLPYGRNSNRKDMHLVLSEGKGTCSSKHALLKAVADENERKVIKLLLVIFEMHQGNTPLIGNTLQDIGLSAIPEAHCVLSINDHFYDYTFPQNQAGEVTEHFLFTKEIEAHQVAEYKPVFHQEFLEKWRAEHCPNLSFSQLWHCREACIRQLQQSID